MIFFKDIELFVLVAEKKSFTSAAKDLMIPTSTASYQIAQFEKELGQQLFSRTTRSVKLTASGRLLYQHLSHVLEDGQIALESLKNMSEIPAGHLHIKVTLNFGTAIIAPLIHKFHQQYPEIDINMELVSRNAPGLLGRCDMIIADNMLPDTSLYCRKIVEIERRLYASPSYLMDSGRVKEPGQLISHKCIGMNYAEHEKVWHLIKGDEHVDVPINPIFSSNGIPMVFNMISHGAGIGPIPVFLTIDFVDQGILTPVLPEWHFPLTPIYLFTHSKILPARCRVFMDFLDAELHKKY